MIAPATQSVVGPDAAYLAAVLDWLRLCFRRRAAGQADSAERKRIAARLSAAERKLAGLATTEPPPHLAALRDRLGLSPFEHSVLLLCVLLELDTDDPSLADLCAEALGDPARRRPTLALARGLFAEWDWRVLTPDSPLRFWQLLTTIQPEPLLTSALRADERIVAHAIGFDTLDERIAPLLSPLDFDAHGALLVDSQVDALESAVSRIRAAARGRSRLVVQLPGSDVAARHLFAWHIARAFGCELYRIPAGALPTRVDEIETLARLWRRECLLVRRVLLLELDDAEPGSAQAFAAARLLERSDGLLLAAAPDVRPGLDADLLVEPRRPEPHEQRQVWEAALSAVDAASGNLAGQLACQFSLNAADISRIASAAARDAGAVWQICRERARPQLDALARRIEPRVGLDDLRLPEYETRQLRAIKSQVEQRSRVYDAMGFRNVLSRGLGISALFAGASGTGKTMAAEALARELCLDLYRIDLAGVVSKYIGETEKNLRKIFDAAEQSGAILFFDEADALFGKRSEVKDSHDRYANIEINYLLQRMEEYGGLAILATNMKDALDPAFVRRLRFIVNFPFPSAAERRAIWDAMFPRDMTEALDSAFLAQLNLTGGSIRNIALHAAFLAAARDLPITMPLVLETLRAEHTKQDRREELRLPPEVRRRREIWRERLPGAPAADVERLAWLPLDDGAIAAFAAQHAGNPPDRVAQLIADAWRGLGILEFKPEAIEVA